MSNLVRFFWKYHYTLLFIGLQFICFALLVQNNAFHQSGFLNATQEFSGELYLLVNNVTEYVDLKKDKQELIEENAMLRNQSEEAFREIRGTSGQTTDSLRMQQYEFVGARIINSTVDKRKNFMTLDKGRLAGIEPDMAVIGSKGIIGIVRSSSDHFAIVMPVIHQEFGVGAELQKNERHFGDLQWGEEGNTDPMFAVLPDFQKHANVEVGDTLVTRSSSALFPHGVPIGTVEDMTIPSGQQTYRIKVRLATDFHSVHYAYVVRNLLKIEQIELEQEVVDDE